MTSHQMPTNDIVDIDNKDKKPDIAINACLYENVNIYSNDSNMFSKYNKIINNNDNIIIIYKQFMLL